MKHVISIEDFSRKDLDSLLAEADKMLSFVKKGKQLDIMKGKIMGALFFEASTRTRLSFESAMHRLSGSVIGFAEPASTSLAKSETIADTVKTISQYCDVIAMRSPFPGAAKLASEVSRVPIINGGDGSREHPTQTMLDMFTIKKEKGRLDDLHIALVGDLKYGRTVHSLCKAFQNYKKIRFTFISPKELAIPNEYKIGEYRETNKLELEDADVVYMTRIQKERFPDQTEYEKLKNIYRITPETMKTMKKDAIIMHPLPRVGEIDWHCDSDPRAVYFKQAFYGVPTRMAIIKMVAGGGN
ncbi:MAG: aspartate carbamoyltransferase [Candidatus Diapherotrites archaeon]|nr:aspartate carbamoyltransferase [Candidatus Diapherotrites archaeon]